MGVAMKSKLRLGLRARLGIAILVGVAGSAALVKTTSAATTTPPFHQCPPVGRDTSCQILIVINPDGSITVLQDPTQPAYDGIEDTLVGVQNNSNVAIDKLTIRSISPIPIFDFDFDGMCG